ncbi:homoserine kinase [Candidatus Nitrosotenuis sp. DW1]|uniref:homoserine kinase n=1 Tax=Candidatus Nitrosotenuis sp. DW1 TaxID=2259672 RepID=UPI0015CD6B91|nr:homoserine kinase [Candidatus Nitrosotenuis sp. DW1]QLH09795.1 homoserine kinase [Candidatus Nitrosotenuis sp. DW1]
MAFSVTAKAPSSTANLGPGFDVFGLALDAFFDEITLTKKKHGIKIITSDLVPTDPKKNTAGLVALHMIKKFKIKGGIEIKIRKGVPAGFGMGSSAASAAATAVAFNHLFRLNLDANTLVECAGVGEMASAGSIHYDNVSASVLGGFVIVRTNPLDVIKIEPPSDLRLCVAVPKLDVPPKKTEVSRSVLPRKITLADSVVNLSNAAAIVAGFVQKDSNLIGTSIRDVIVEPARQHLIPGFSAVKKNALRAGALGVTISGAGPSVIAFATKKSDMQKIAKSMKRGFASARTDCTVLICKPSNGAKARRTT